MDFRNQLPMVLQDIVVSYLQPSWLQLRAKVDQVLQTYNRKQVLIHGILNYEFRHHFWVDSAKKRILRRHRKAKRTFYSEHKQYMFCHEFLTLLHQIIPYSWKAHHVQSYQVQYWIGDVYGDELVLEFDYH